MLDQYDTGLMSLPVLLSMCRSRMVVGIMSADRQIFGTDRLRIMEQDEDQEALDSSTLSSRETRCRRVEIVKRTAKKPHYTLGVFLFCL
jgi:hypothetical protein